MQLPSCNDAASAEVSPEIVHHRGKPALQVQFNRSVGNRQSWETSTPRPIPIASRHHTAAQSALRSLYPSRIAADICLCHGSDETAANCDHLACLRIQSPTAGRTDRYCTPSISLHCQANSPPGPPYSFQGSRRSAPCSHGLIVPPVPTISFDPRFPSMADYDLRDSRSDRSHDFRFQYLAGRDTPWHQRAAAFG